MKKTFKMAVLAACTVLCWGFTSCFGFVAETSGGNSENTETQDENDEESLDDEQNTEPVKTPSPIKNFKVTQKEGTNFLIFSWKKLEGMMKYVIGLIMKMDLVQIIILVIGIVVGKII